MTAGGPSFDRTRAGAEKFGPNQPPHRLHAPARSPPRHMLQLPLRLPLSAVDRPAATPLKFSVFCNLKLGNHLVRVKLTECIQCRGATVRRLADSRRVCGRWGSILRSHAGRGRKVWAKPATTPLDAPARSPQAQGGARRGAALAARVLIPLPKCGVPPHTGTEYNMRKVRRCDMSRFEPTSRVSKSSHLSIRPN